MKFIKYFLVSAVLFLSNVILANPLDDYIYSLEEQDSLVGWVKENAQIKLLDSEALTIIRQVYANASFNNLSPHLILAVIKTESGFRKKAKSSEGASGLMQVIPRWHKDKLKKRNVFDTKVSIEVGSKILSDCMVKHKNNNFKALNCYSGGGGKKYYSKVFSYKKVITAFVNNTDLRNSVIVASR